jgi:hypothetical protein
MVGMLQIITYLLCVYLVFKGVEIFQIALMGANEKQRGKGYVIGALMIVASLIAAVAFTALIDNQAKSISEGLNDIPRGLPSR